MFVQGFRRLRNYKPVNRFAVAEPDRPIVMSAPISGISCANCGHHVHLNRNPMRFFDYECRCGFSQPSKDLEAAAKAAAFSMNRWTKKAKEQNE